MTTSHLAATTLLPFYENIVLPNYKQPINDVASCALTPTLVQSKLLEEIQGHSYENISLIGPNVLLLIQYDGHITYHGDSSLSQLYSFHIQFYKACYLNLPSKLCHQPISYLFDTHALVFNLAIAHTILTPCSPHRLLLSWILSLYCQYH